MVTQGSKKINNYIDILFKSSDFLKFVEDSKHKYAIPPHGFIEEKNKYNILNPPTKWKGNLKKYDKLIDDIENFCRNKGLYYQNFYTYIYDFIIYDKALDPINDELCVVRDLINNYELKNDSPPNVKQIIEDLEKDENIIYPIVIKISPYASIRDILDFIKKNSQTIKKLQLKHKKENIKIGKYKTRNKYIKERDEFIYMHRDKPLKKIMGLMFEKFGDDPNHPDIGAIGKIISLEKKKRKEV